MKKVSNGQIVDFINSTMTLKNKKLPLKLSFALKHNLKLAAEAYQTYEAERDELLKTQKEDPMGFQKNLGELLSEEVELSIKVVPMKIIELTETENYDTLTFGEVNAMEFMIEEESDDNPECS